MNAEQLAKLFHETYEELAPNFNYETRKASAKPWAEVPKNNKRLMIAVAEKILSVKKMAKYRKIPIVIEATQWFKSGDHPEVIYPMPNTSHKADIRCEKCTKAIGKHGWIDTLEGGHIVCPADWIIQEPGGEHYYPCKPDIFEQTYEIVK